MKARNHIVASAVLIVLVVGGAGCAAKHPEVAREAVVVAPVDEQAPVERARRIAQKTAYRRTEAGFSAEEKRAIVKNCGPFGMPKIDPAWDMGPTKILVRQGYVLQHSSVDKIPVWVCEGLTRNQTEGDANRQNNFEPDPLLVKGQRSELADYKGSGYDRGHQAPAADFKCCQDLTDESFFLSNMVPQDGPMNRGIWASLEDTVRGWVKDRGDVFVVTGPMFFDPAEEDSGTADGSIEFDQIGKNAVAVPTHLYKIAISKNDQGKWEAVGFVLENRKYDQPFPFSDSIQAIDWIEDHTGVNVFPELDAVQQKRLESKPGHMW